MIGPGMIDFGGAPQTAGLAGGLSPRAARRGGGASSPSAAPAKLPAVDFLRQLLTHAEQGLSLTAALRRMAVRQGARSRLQRLLSRIPPARRAALNAAGKLRFLLALPAARLAPRRKARRHCRRAAAQQRRLNRLAPAARLQLLNTYARLRAGGMSGQLAARRAGAGVVTLWRWQRRYAQGGMAALATQFHRSGRKPAFTVVVPAAVLAAVRRLNVERGGNLPAWRAYLASAECAPSLRAALRGKPVPDALLRATRLTRTKVNLHTGPGVLAVGPLPGTSRKFHFLTA